MAQEDQKEGVISIIAALGKDRVIGGNNDLLWHLPEDLKRFKALTMGHPVIMGRKTWESLPEKYRPLPGRTNFVVTRADWYETEGAQVVHSLPEAISYAREAEGSGEIFVIGGGELYGAALPFASRLYLTLVDSDATGDIYFPRYEEEFTKETARETGTSGELAYTWVTLERP